MIINKYDDLYVIKLYKNIIKNMDIFNIDDVSMLFKEVLIQLKTKYEVKGYCEVEVFTDKEYGMIIEIENIDKYGNDIDIKVKFHIDSLFMHEIYFEDKYKYDECYLYNNKYYVKYKYMYDSEIIYKDAGRIIRDGIKIE